MAAILKIRVKAVKFQQPTPHTLLNKVMWLFASTKKCHQKALFKTMAGRLLRLTMIFSVLLMTARKLSLSYWTCWQHSTRSILWTWIFNGIKRNALECSDIYTYLLATKHWLLHFCCSFFGLWSTPRVSSQTIYIHIGLPLWKMWLITMMITWFVVFCFLLTIRSCGVIFILMSKMKPLAARLEQCLEDQCANLVSAE